MVKTDYEEKTITKKIAVCETTICDGCQKILCRQYGEEYKPNDTPWRDYTQNVEFFRITTGHNDWGNDSCESIEHHTYCRECLAKPINAYLARTKVGKDTEYIEVEHKCYRSLPF